MDTVVGLGAAGCRLADEFSKYDQYDVYKIDTNIKGTNCFELQKQSNPEDYERFCPDLRDFLHSISGNVLFIVAGCGKISGATLKILQQLKNCNISLLFIISNKNDLTHIGSLQERVTFNVLQEYARSGLLNKIFLISNNEIENIIGDVPILQNTKKINELIVTVIHYINIFSNTEPVVDNYEKPDAVCRISTIGIYDFSLNKEKYFFNLTSERSKVYYFAVTESMLNTDNKLLKNIREIVSKNDSRVSYQVFQTKYEKAFCYFVSDTNVIQVLDN